MGHAGLPLDSSLPPRHNAHTANARTFLQVDWYEHLHAVVTSPLPEVSSKENLEAGCPVARHLDSTARRACIVVSVDYFGPLPVTPRGKTYILLFTDRFSRRADMYAVTAAKFTAEGTANIPISRYIPLWGCPRSILLDNGLRFCS